MEMNAIVRYKLTRQGMMDRIHVAQELLARYWLTEN